MLQDIDQQTSLHLNNEAQFLCFTLDDSNPLGLFSSTQSPKDAQNIQQGINYGTNTLGAQNGQNLANANGTSGDISQHNLQHTPNVGSQHSLQNTAQGVDNASLSANQNLAQNALSVCPHCGGSVCPHCGNVVDSIDVAENGEAIHHSHNQHSQNPQNEQNLNTQDSIYSGASTSIDMTSVTHNSAQNSLISNVSAHATPQTQQVSKHQHTKAQHTNDENPKSHPHPLLANLEPSVFSPTSAEKMGEQLYAINVFKVREIIYYDGELTETAGENDGLVLGFLTVRGESMPLIDMRRWLYFSSNDPHRDLRPFSISSKKSLVVICHFSSQNVGLKILGVKRIINKNWGEITAGGEFGFDGESKVVATTKYDDGSVIQILDVERMVADAFPDMAQNKLEIDNLQAIHSDKLILVAEDSKTASKALGLILEHLHLHYMTFANGEGLLDYLYSDNVASQVGAVITDLEMPKISGFEVLKRIKNSQESRHIPVIVNSSMSSDSNVEMAQKLGADAFISKSNPAEVEEYLRKFLI